MELLSDLAEWSLLAFALVLFVAQVLAREIGGWIGRRRATQRGRDVENTNLVVGGMLGLVAFVLALTLSFSNTRFQDRQAGALAEANAIGTAWLRAEAVGHPRGSAIARLLEEYGRQRMAFVQAPRSGGAVGMISQRTVDLQTEIWGHVSAFVRERQDPVAVGLMAAVNEAFDASAAERFVIDVRTPPQMIWLLLAMTVLGTGTLGYRLGLKGQTFGALSTLLVAMWTTIIVVILDLGAPRIGGMGTTIQAYEWTLQGFVGGVPIPPLPAPR